MRKTKLSVALMVVDDENRMLILKRGKKSRYEEGLWEQCGGVVEEGESFRETAKREAFEELGIKIEILKEMLFDTFSDMGDGVVWKVKLFKVKALGEPRIMEPEKCVELKWVTRDELIEMKDELVTHFQEDLKRLGWI